MAERKPVVLVGEDAVALGRSPGWGTGPGITMSASSAVMVGDPSWPATAAAAAEMAGELWPWARTDRDGTEEAD